MKLTDPNIIKEGEKDLINAIEDDLDLDSINEIIKDKLKVKNLQSKGGKIVVHNNEIAFKIKFELSMDGSVMFDRDGNYISDNGENSIDDNQASNEETEIETDTKEAVEDKIDEDKTDKDKTDKEEIDPEDKVENIAQELIVEDDFADVLDDSESSEIDLDIEGMEDTEADELDFSDDEDIDDILKESREFWENKKS